MCTTQHTDRSHLSQDDRAVIEALRAQGETLRAIAEAVQTHYSTICRELLRNCDASGAYTARRAHMKCTARRLAAKHASRKIENDTALERAVEEKLRGKHTRGDWSPAIIAHVLGHMCHQTIYSWIQRSRPELRRLLPRCGKYRRQYGTRRVPTSKGWMTNMRSIETRPEAACNRTILGHYEGDTVLLNRSLALLTVVERKSKFLLAQLVHARFGMAYAVHEALITCFSRVPASHLDTITPDRGAEFAWWEMTEQEVPGLKFYFAHARAPWERGTNEHTNGLVRRYFPKREKHATITSAQVADVVWMINHRPRKSLNWETPCKVFGACCISS